MTFKRLRRNWDALGKTDPFWAILSVPDKKGNRWDLDEFLATGRRRSSTPWPTSNHWVWSPSPAGPWISAAERDG